VEITNTMTTRTTGAINLGPNNMTGGHKFFSLTTGEILTRQKWTELPVPNEVILRLSDLSKDDEHSDVSQLIYDNDDIEATEETHTVGDEPLGNNEETKIVEHEPNERIDATKTEIVEHVKELPTKELPTTGDELNTTDKLDDEIEPIEEIIASDDKPAEAAKEIDTVEETHTDETQSTHRT
jgi:hypothetical protein